MVQSTNSGLVRGIGRWSLVAVAINGIIGAGIFGMPSEVFGRIGVYSLAAFVVCALVVALIVLCFAEVGSRFSESGGPYLYAREAFGPLPGFQVGWLMWLARLTAFAANLNLAVDYLGFFWRGAGSGFWRAVVIIAVVVALTTINVIGVRDAARASNIFTVGKLLPIFLFVGAGLFFINPQNYSAGPAPGFGQFSSSVLLLVYAFTGFEMAAIPAGEVENPRRNLPMAMLSALAGVTVIYILIQVVCIGTLPELAATKTPLADASGRFLGVPGASIITAGALISVIGNLNVLILAASRLPFAMAERRELPRLLGRTHRRFRTPHNAILVTAAVMLAFTLTGTFVYAATISAIARLLAYAATCAALPVLRRKPAAPAAQFKAPVGVLVAGAALVLSIWLLSTSTRAQAGYAAIAAGVGVAIYGAYQVWLRRRGAAVDLTLADVGDSTNGRD